VDFKDTIRNELIDFWYLFEQYKLLFTKPEKGVALFPSRGIHREARASPSPFG
jgi:hypothetical protein